MTGGTAFPEGLPTRGWLTGLFRRPRSVPADPTGPRRGSVDGRGSRADAVTVDDLTVRYGQHTVLDGIGLHLPAGTALALVGDNGTGKSTLLRCVAGLQAPTGGQVRVFEMVPGTSLRFWRDVATTVESPTWYPGLTVREHLRLVRVSHGLDPDDGQIERLGDVLGIDALGDSLPGTLSSGQRQRFLLTAVLLRPSRLLLLDEPEQRLDATVRQAVAAHLRRYVASGGTVLMASHDPDFIDAVGCRSLRVPYLDRPPAHDLERPPALDPDRPPAHG